MKCFHFTKGERPDGGDNRGRAVSRAASSTKVPWTRSLCIASSSVFRRRSEFDSESTREFTWEFDSDSAVTFCDFLTHLQANDLCAFAFAELESASSGFSRAFLIGEGGFGCVYTGVVKVPDEANEGRDLSQ